MNKKLCTLPIPFPSRDRNMLSSPSQGQCCLGIASCVCRSLVLSFDLFASSQLEMNPIRFHFLCLWLAAFVLLSLFSSLSEFYASSFLVNSKKKTFKHARDEDSNKIIDAS